MHALYRSFLTSPIDCLSCMLSRLCISAVSAMQTAGICNVGTEISVSLGHLVTDGIVKHKNEFIVQLLLEKSDRAHL